MIDRLLPLTLILVFLGAAAIGAAAILREMARGSKTLKELILTLIVLACGVVPVNIFVFAPAQFLSWGSYFWYLTIPSTILALGILIYAYAAGMERFFNRYWVGIWAGVIGTIVLDAVRLTGYKMGWMPYDVPRVAGTMIFDSMLTGPTPLSDFVGYANHFWIGANIGFLYTLIFGRTHWIGSVLWLLFYEAGMMISPAVIMMAGPFGLQFGYGILAVSFTAHVVFGLAQGLLVQRYVKEKGTILQLLSNGGFFFGPKGAAYVKQKEESALEIELLYINGCPSYPVALDLLKEVLREKGFDIPIKFRCIGTEQEARESRFLGSPTIRTNGEDIEIGADRRGGYSLSCRIYQEGGRPSGVPSKEMIRQALWRAVEPRPGCC